MGRKLTFGDRAADFVVDRMGSWGFILTQIAIMGFWVLANATVYVRHWDPYPFIFLNLALSMQAAFAASLVLIAQKRSDARSRMVDGTDYLVDVSALELLHRIAEKLGIDDQGEDAELQEYNSLAEDVESEP